MDQKTIRLQLAVVVLVFLWGYSWLVMKQASMYIAPALFTALRGGIAFLLLFIFVYLRKQPSPKIPLVYGISTGLFQITGMQGFSQLALSYGDAGKVSILAYTMPIWLTLLSGIFLKEKIKGGFYIQTLFVIIGMLLLVHPWNARITFYSYFFALLSGLSWALGCVLMKKLYLVQPNVDLLKLTTIQMLVTAIVCGVIAIITWHPGNFVVNPLSLYVVFFNSVAGSAGGWFLLAYILRQTPPGKSHLSLMLVPVVGLALSAIFLNERLNLAELTGVVLILLMCLLNKSGK